LYGLQAGIAVGSILVSSVYLFKIKRYPETLLGPTAFLYAITSLIFSVARVVDPVGRTIGNDPLVTTAYSLSCMFLFALDHVIVFLYVDETANSVYRETSLDLDNLATRLRNFYLPKSLLASIFLSSVPTMCMLASSSSIITEILTGLQWLLYALMGICFLTILLIFMGACIRAFDSAINSALLSPGNRQILPVLQRMRASIAQTRLIVCAVLVFDLCACLIVAPWPAAQANLSYIVPYMWIINTLGIFRIQYMYGKPYLTVLFGGVSTESSNASPSLQNPNTNNGPNQTVNDTNFRNFVVIGGSMSTGVDGEDRDAPARQMVAT